jgi:hypothetical protein
MQGKISRCEELSRGLKRVMYSISFCYLENSGGGGYIHKSPAGNPKQYHGCLQFSGIVMAKGHVRNDSDDPLTRNRKLEEALLRANLAFDAKLSDFGVTFSRLFSERHSL